MIWGCCIDNILTFVQLFTIGFTFGLSAPCIVVCMPALFFYVSNKTDNIFEAIIKISILLAGRLLAYMFLGILIGFSMQKIQHFLGFIEFPGIKLLAGIIIVLFGVSVWRNQTKTKDVCAKKLISHQKMQNDFSYLFILGFIIGISPCAPLIALLFEMVLFVKSPLQGLLFLTAFGFGTFLSGLLVFGVMNGLFKFIANKTFFSHPKFQDIYRKISAVLIIILGLYFLLK